MNAVFSALERSFIGTEVDEFNLPLLRFPDGLELSSRQLCRGVGIIASPDSGKTVTMLSTFGRAFLRRQWGGLVLVVKPQLVADFRALVAAEKREPRPDRFRRLGHPSLQPAGRPALGGGRGRPGDRTLRIPGRQKPRDTSDKRAVLEVPTDDHPGTADDALPAPVRPLRPGPRRRIILAPGQLARPRWPIRAGGKITRSGPRSKRPKSPWPRAATLKLAYDYFTREFPRTLPTRASRAVSPPPSAQYPRHFPGRNDGPPL
jgi:hypothetical protein